MSTRSRKNLLLSYLRKHRDYFKHYAPLYEASIQGDWKSAQAILREKPELVRYSLTKNGETALHVAAASANRSKQMVEFVKNLVDLMEKADLTRQNNQQNTALYLAAASGNLETVQIMLKKNETLHTIPGENKRLPLYAAALFGNKDVVKHLYSISDLSDDGGWNDFSRYYLIERCVQSDMFDIALNIVEKHRTIGRNNKPLASQLLGVLAGKPEAFSKSKSSFLKGTVNSVFAFIGLEEEKESQALKLLRTLWEDIVKLPKKDIDVILKGPQDKIEIDKESSMLQAIQLQKVISEQLKELENTYENERRLPELKELVSQYVLKMHTETQNIIKDENKMRSFKGDKARKLVKIISKFIVELFNESQKKGEAETLHKLISDHIEDMREAKHFDPSQNRYSSRVLFIAAEMGNTNFIVELIRRYPDLIWQLNDDGFSIFHIAVRHRHAGIYSLLYEIGPMKDMITPLKDINDNNMLHLVGKTVNRKQLKNASGACEPRINNLDITFFVNYKDQLSTL